MQHARNASKRKQTKCAQVESSIPACLSSCSSNPIYTRVTTIRHATIPCVILRAEIEMDDRDGRTAELVQVNDTWVNTVPTVKSLFRAALTNERARGGLIGAVMMNGTVRAERGPSSGTHLNDLKRRIIRKLECNEKLAAEEKRLEALRICRVSLFTEGLRFCRVITLARNIVPSPIINDRSTVLIRNGVHGSLVGRYPCA